MKPVKVITVTATMLCGHVLESELVLDSILMAVHPAMHNLSRATRSSTSAEQAPLPFLKVGDRSNWVWCASAADYPAAPSLGTARFSKRRAPEDVFHAARAFQPASGTMRDRMERRTVVESPTITFRAATCDVSEVKRLLRRVGNLGGLRKMGYGEVRNWDVVEEAGPSWRDVLVSAGVACRRLPAALVCDAELSTLTVRPPYWMPAAAIPAAATGLPCRLQEDVRAFWRDQRVN